MSERSSNVLQMIRKHKTMIMFVVFCLVALVVFILSFFSSPTLVVGLRVISVLILLIPLAFIILIRPIFSSLSEGMCRDDRNLRERISDYNEHISLRIDDPNSKDWIFSDERLYGKSFGEYSKAILRRYYPDPSPESELARAYEIESDTAVRKRRHFGRGGKPYESAYPDLHTNMLTDFMAGGKLEGIETEEKRINRLKRNPIFSQEISISEKIIEDLEGKNAKIHVTSKGITYSFNFDSSHKFSILIGATIRLDAENRVILEAILKTYQPFSLSLLDLENNENDRNDVIKEFEKYTINTTYSLDYKKILEKEKFRDAFSNLQSKLERLVISEKFLSLSLKDPKGVSQTLELAIEIYKELLLFDLGVVEISEVRCYTCDAEFKTDVEKCQKCGALRPRCIVCRLDLFPSEKAKIISLPCCGVISHKNHIIMWLRKNKTCPNCKKSLSQWLDKLDITDV